MPDRIPIETRWKIVFLRYENGLTQPQIAARVNCTKGTVSKILSKYDSTGTVEDLPRSGRRRLLDLNRFPESNNPIILAVRAGNYSWKEIEK